MSPAFVHASVDVGTTCTQYLRAGAGASVIVVGRRAFANAAGNTLVRELARSFRVIVPDLRDDHGPSPCDALPVAGFASWLREFLDGLGVLNASVIAYDDFALRALSFGLTDPLRVRCLVLFYQDGPDPVVQATAAPEPLGQSKRPVLLRRQPTRDTPHDHADVDVIVNFLLDGIENERN